jgi:shikimate dehydrogenase
MALIGKGISHSKSAEIYKDLLGVAVDYTLLDYENEALIPPLKDLLIKYPRISITAPYKNDVFRKIDLFVNNILELDFVNAIRFKDGKVLGTNTDILAFDKIFKESYSHFDKVYILGDGSMSQMAQKYFDKEDVSYQVFSRKQNTLSLLSATEFSKVLIINCCSREYTFCHNIESSSVFWDMNYNMEKHKEYFNQINANYIDGYSLLKQQAIFALSFWN